MSNCCRPLFIALFSIALMAAYALVRELHLGVNIDNSWLLYAAQRAVDGQKLYVDIMETNPPLIVWMSMLPVYIGKWLHIEPKLVFPWLITALHLGLLWFTYSIMCVQKIFADTSFRLLVISYIALWIFFFTTFLYGQREVLWIALVLPYLLQSLSASSQPFTARHFMVALLAGVGFALKPFFLLLWICNELYIAFEKRSLRSLFGATNWIIGFIQLIYVAAVYCLTPEFITTILPVLKHVYFGYNAELPRVMGFLFGSLVCIGALAWLAEVRGELVPFIKRAHVWLFGCALVILLQRKLWLNHEYPIGFMGALILLLLLVALYRDWRLLKLDIGHRKFIALCQVVALMAGLIYLEAQFTYIACVKPSKIHTELREAIERYAPGGEVYGFSTSLEMSFPLISESAGIFHGGFHHLWPYPGLVILEQRSNNDPETIKVREFMMNTLVHDFTAFPPQLVWVDENVNMGNIAGYDINLENRDIITVLTRDKRFAKLWKNYKKVGEIEGEPNKENPEEKPARFSLYERKT